MRLSRLWDHVIASCVYDFYLPCIVCGTRTNGFYHGAGFGRKRFRLFCSAACAADPRIQRRVSAAMHLWKSIFDKPVLPSPEQLQTLLTYAFLVDAGAKNSKEAIQYMQEVLRTLPAPVSY